MNALISVRFTLNLPTEKIEALMGRPDDDSDAYYEHAIVKAEDWVRDNLPDALELASDEPDVEGH